jgi:glycosyltransferase involved in cell wall biosynthesis
VSVIVPVFNGEDFVAECLESIAAQTFPATEVIVVDDGSTDGSAAVADAFDGVRVLRLAHQGSGRARNAGVDATTGDLVAFCDADDSWHATKIEQQVEYLDGHPDVACVLCRTVITVEPGTEIPTWLARDVVFGDLGGVSPISGLYRRQAIEDVDGFRDYPQGQDFDMLVRMQERGSRIEILPEQLLMRRMHDNNSTHRVGSLAPGFLRSVREHLRRTQ